MPPHDCAAWVRAKNRYKKRTFSHLFGSCRERTDPRVVAQTANLFATSSVQFGRSVEARSAAAQMCGRGIYVFVCRKQYSRKSFKQVVLFERTYNALNKNVVSIFVDYTLMILRLLEGGDVYGELQNSEL